MAYLDSTDAAGNVLRYELPEGEGVLITLGSAADATLNMTAPGVLEHHAAITPAAGQYAIAPMEGAVLVNEAAITEPMLLVEGVHYSIGSLQLSFVPSAPEQEEEPQEQGESEEEQRRRKVRRKKNIRAAAALAAATASATKENPLVTIITPFYVIAVVAAAFVAGLTLRYWLMTGGFLPADWLR